jgi:hypothetical protein
MHRTIVFGLCLLLLFFRSACADEPLDKLLYPLSKAKSAAAPKIELDLTEVSDDAKVRDWAEHSQALCQDWYPIMCRFLATDDWTPPEAVRLVLKKDLAIPGATTGATIQISVKWISEHPDDFGMVIHELTHVIQAYPPGTQPGWLVEGIADYIRYWRFEPEKRHGPVAPTASYRDGYGTTGAFLAWLVAKYDHRLVRRLDDALRHGQYSDGIFRAATGQDLDALWKEYVAEAARTRG